MIEVLSVKADSAAAARRLRDKSRGALARAVNRSAGSAWTLLSRLVAKDLAVNQTFVRTRLEVKKAIPSEHPFATIVASADRIPVYAHRPSPNLPPSRGRGTGVSWRANGRRVREPNAFIAQMRSGHVGVFKRVGTSFKKSQGAWSKNLHIDELKGASVWYVATKYAGEASARGTEQLVKNTRHELRWALRS